MPAGEADVGGASPRADDSVAGGESVQGSLERTGHPAGDVSHGQPEPGPTEIGGRKGPDPVRYGDWEKNGRCIDF
ncbi:DUF1674 domain-containing protein [Halomonas denitrificans]|nr:DUF1674 domain-containing protein [Halomonas denitrificans]